MLVDPDTGNRFFASTVPALFAPGSTPTPTASTSHTHSSLQTMPSSFGAAGDNRREVEFANEGGKHFGMAYLFAALSFFVCPLIFPFLGWQSATRAEGYGSTGASTAKIVIVLCAVASIAVGVGVAIKMVKVPPSVTSTPKP